MQERYLKRCPFLRSGFTLVELLVVIAIIGILAAVVIGSLNDAREEGVEAKIKSELSTLTKRANIERVSSFTFDVVCGSNSLAQSAGIVTIIEAIERFSPELVVCNSESENYAVSAAVSPSTYWCVDSTGFSDYVPAQLGVAEFACPF